MTDEQNRFLTEAQRHRASELEELTLISGAIIDASVCKVDLFVNSSVVVEIKSLPKLGAVEEKQLLTYLRLLNRRLGLLLNFGAPIMKSGIQRVINGF
jgi:GxxExxY protein